MNKFVTHEAVATGWFNLGHSSSTASMSHWEGELEGTEDMLSILVDRMGHDYESLSPKMRKAWTSRELDARFLSGMLQRLQAFGGCQQPLLSVGQRT